MQVLFTLYGLFCSAQSAACFFMSFRKEYDAACEEDGPLFSIWVYRAGVVLWALMAVAVFLIGRV